MKRFVFYVSMGLTLGAVSGDMLVATAAENGLNARLADRQATKAGHDALGDSDPLVPLRATGNATIELAERDGDPDQLPQTILDARARGATARQKAIEQAIGQVFPKGGTWGMGGPLFPLASPFTGEPLPRPTRLASLAVPGYIPNPAGAPVPPGGWMFGPGDPRSTPHIVHDQQFTPKPPPPQPVPEPSTWLLMLLGFAALALRLRRSRRSILVGDTGLEPVAR